MATNSLYGAARTLGILLASMFSLALVAAAATTFPAPAVVVYPLTGTGGTPAEAGGNVAILLSTKLADLGGLTMRPYTPGTERAQFLAAAVAQNDDYYITGYLTPVGNDVSLIVQVVSTQSGSVVYSSSATVQTYADVVAQADPLREAILHHAARGFPTVNQVSSAATPEPLASGGSVNLTRALGRHARTQATATPSATASGAPASSAPVASAAPVAAAAATPVARSLVATAAAPHARATANALVVDIDGDAPPIERTHAQAALAQGMLKTGLRGEIIHVSSTDAQRNAASICAANAGAAAFLTGTLSDTDGAVQFVVTARSCTGNAIAQTHSAQPISTRGGAAAAIDRAAAANIAAISAAVAPLATAK